MKTDFDNNKDILINYDRLKHLHSICGYLAMFPPEVPREYIEKYTIPGDLVYEPFSGRGTTTLEARVLKRRIISNDLSPLAYVLTKAKTYNIDHEKLIKRIKWYEKKYNEWLLSEEFKQLDFNDEIFNDFKVFYSENNLKQLYFLREKLGKRWNDRKLTNIDNYILAISLGIMHGPSKKDGTSTYFSIQTPNGMSVAPNYAKNFIEKNNLKPIESNIFEQIIKRAAIKRNDFLKDDLDNKVFNNDALNSSKFVKETPKLIFTSPPYVNIVRYISQNWIRFWMFGLTRNDTKEKIVDDYHALESYKIFLISFMKEMEKIMNNDTIFIMVIGDVKKIFINEIMNQILPKTNLEFFDNPIPQKLKRKTTRQMGKKVGKATEIDWIFTLKIKR